MLWLWCQVGFVGIVGFGKVCLVQVYCFGQGFVVVGQFCEWVVIVEYEEDFGGMEGINCLCFGWWDVGEVIEIVWCILGCV